MNDEKERHPLSIGEDKFPIITDFFDPNIEPVVFKDWLSLEDTISISDLFVLTPIGFYLFRITETEIELKLSKTYHELTAIDYLTNTFTLQFSKEKYKFISKKASEICNQIYIQMSAIFLEEELGPFPQVMGFSPSKPNPTVFSFYRLQSLLKKEKIKISSKTLLEYLKYLKEIEYHEADYFDIDLFPDLSDYFSIVLNSILINNNTTNLRLSIETRRSKWKSICTFITKNRYVNQITSCIPFDKYFTKFCKLLISSSNRVLQQLGFCGIEFTDDSVDSLQNLIFNQSIQFINFENVFIEKVESKLSSLFKDSRNKLVFTNFSNVSLRKNIGLCSSFFVQLHCLNLISVDVELSKLLHFLSESHVSECNFSGNPCKSPISVQKCQFPNSLKHIILNHIHWMPSNLYCILQISQICNHQHMITLADCRMSKPEWSSFYKSFGNGLKSPNLVSFVWIDNPIHNHLFSFLSHTSIKFLSLAGFRSMDKSYLGYLESANLEAIDLHGTRRKRVREIDDVMLALSKNRSISMIDISNNRINDNNLPMLLKMLNSVKNYAEIIFDGNDFSVEMLTKITQVLDQRANLLVHFPAVSVSKLSEVSEQTMVNLKKKFRGIQKAFVRKTFYDDLWKMLIAREYPFENNETFVEEQPQSFSEKSSSLKSVEIKPKLDEISWEIEFVEPMFDDFSLKEELKNQFTFEKCKERLSASKK